ncbi:MAG: hypothetical protein QGI60_02970, partial [archaeon]|nr:hypothetical protein [archaeon]
KIISLTEEQEKELNDLLKAQQIQRLLAKERRDIAKQEAIIQKEGIKSRAGLKAQLFLVTKELNKLTVAETKNTDRGKELIKTQKQLTDSLKNVEEQGGITRRSVGDYAKAFLGSIKPIKATRKALQSTEKSLKSFALRLTVGRSVVEGLANGVRSAVQGLGNLIDEAEGTNETFNKITNSGARLTATLKNTGRGFLNTFGGVISDVIDNVAFAIDSIATGLTEASKGNDFFAKSLQFVIKVLKDFPAIFGGIGGVVEELIGRFQRFGRETSLIFEQLTQKVYKAYDALLGRDVTLIDKRLKEIRKELDNNVISSKTFSEAYKEAFDSTKKAQAEFKKRSQELAIEEEKRAKEQEKRTKRQEARQRKRQEEERKRQEELKQLVKDREEALSSAEEQRIGRALLIQKLLSEVEDLEAERIESNTERLIKQEDIRFQRQERARKQNFETLKRNIQKEQDEIERLFGNGSKEAFQNQNKNNQSLLDLQRAFDSLGEEQEKKHQVNLAKIREDAAAKEKADREKAFKEEIDDIEKQIKKEQEAEEAGNEEATRTIKENLEDREKLIDAGVNIFQSVSGAVTEFLRIAQEQDAARLEAALERRRESISNLNEQLEGATGLQKRFLERQLKNEEAALKREEEITKESERKRANDAKAVALGLAAINGAIAIIRAFSDLGPVAGAVTAVAVGSTLAVQVAEIAAQKFQDGGMIDGPSHSNGGVPILVGGSKMIEAEGGEFIVKKEAVQNNFDLIKRINESNGPVLFENGGIVGSPSIAPSGSFAATATQQSRKELEAIKANSNAILAISQAQQDLQVNLVYTELEEENQKNVSITQKTTFR